MITLYIIYAVTTGIISTILSSVDINTKTDYTTIDKIGNALLTFILGQFTILFALYILTTNQHQSNTNNNDY
jgi:hypothetical protein